MKILFAFVAVALVCVTALPNFQRSNDDLSPIDVNSIYSDVERGLIDDLVKEAKDLVDKLVKSITANLGQPIKDITDVQKIIQNIYDDSIKILKQTYVEQEEKLLADVREVVNCYKKEADKLGVSLKECVDKTQNQLLAIPESFLKNITQCAVDEYDGAMAIVNEALGIYNSLIDETKSFPAKISNCASQSFWNMPGCFGGLITEIGGLTLSITTKYVPKLTALSTSATVYVGGMKARIIACGSFKTASLGVSCTGLTLDFVNCAKSKIPNPVQCLN